MCYIPLQEQQEQDQAFKKRLDQKRRAHLAIRDVNVFLCILLVDKPLCTQEAVEHGSGATDDDVAEEGDADEDAYVVWMGGCVIVDYHSNNGTFVTGS
jgi:hypothetical protein